MSRVIKRIIHEMADAIERGRAHDGRPLEMQINEIVSRFMYPCSKETFRAYREALRGELERRKRERESGELFRVTSAVLKDAHAHELRFGSHERDDEPAESPPVLR